MVTFQLFLFISTCITAENSRESRGFTVERLPWVQSVTLHTNLGDLKLEIFCEEVPRTAENFLALCASNYYDTTIFHRNIRGWALIQRFELDHCD